MTIRGCKKPASKLRTLKYQRLTKAQLQFLATCTTNRADIKFKLLDDSSASETEVRQLDIPCHIDLRHGLCQASWCKTSLHLLYCIFKKHQRFVSILTIIGTVDIGRRSRNRLIRSWWAEESGKSRERCGRDAEEMR